jgi:hypothetical protein
MAKPVVKLAIKQPMVVESGLTQPPPREGSNRLPILAEKINATYRYHKKTSEEFAKQTIEIGKLLLEARVIVGHGRWGDWIRKNCDFSHSTAGNYMRIAESGLNFATVANMGMRLVRQKVADHIIQKQLRKGEPKGKRGRVPPRYRHRKDPNRTELKMPWLEKGQVFRVEWETTDGVLYQAYVWLDDDPLIIAEFNWIILRYTKMEEGSSFDARLQRDKAIRTGDHRTNEYGPVDRDEALSTLSALMRVWDGDKRRMVIDVAYDTQVWDADDITLQLLGEWQKSIQIAAHQIHSAKREARGLPTRKAQ